MSSTFETRVQKFLSYYQLTCQLPFRRSTNLIKLLVTGSMSFKGTKKSVLLVQPSWKKYQNIF